MRKIRIGLLLASGVFLLAIFQACGLPGLGSMIPPSPSISKEVGSSYIISAPDLSHLDATPKLHILYWLWPEEGEGGNDIEPQNAYSDLLKKYENDPQGAIRIQTERGVENLYEYEANVSLEAFSLYVVQAVEANKFRVDVTDGSNLLYSLTIENPGSRSFGLFAYLISFELNNLDLVSSPVVGHAPADLVPVSQVFESSASGQEDTQ